MLNLDWPDSGDIFNDRHDYHKAYCNAWVATAIIGSAGIGALSTAYSANKAASTQAEAAQRGAQTLTQNALKGASGVQDGCYYWC
jgi:hypothetical protein